MNDPYAPPLRILLVVDTEPTIATVAIPLTQAGHALAMVQQAHEVFGQIDKQPWDAVIIDLSPLQTALDLIQQIRQRAADLSIILLTDEPQPDLLEAGFGAGVYDWLFKPPAFPLVIAALNRARERRALRTQTATPAAGTSDGLGSRHEINNQLAGIIGLVQLHLADERLPADLRQDLTLVLTHAQRLHGLLKPQR